MRKYFFKDKFLKYGRMGGFAKVDNEKWLQGGSIAFFSSLTIHRFFRCLLLRRKKKIIILYLRCDCEAKNL
jgi:hypothetical protein